METTSLYAIFRNYPIITTDSRNIPTNSIFFALRGDKFNGNVFAEEALSKGASYAVIDEPEFATNDRTILVDDVLLSLQQLAQYHRKQLGLPHSCNYRNKWLKQQPKSLSLQSSPRNSG